MQQGSDCRQPDILRTCGKGLIRQCCEVWVKPLDGTRCAIGFFNTGNQRRTVKVPLSLLKLKSPQNVRDLWKQEDAGTIRQEMNVELNPHGASLFLLDGKK